MGRMRGLLTLGVPVALGGSGGKPAKIYGVSWNKGSNPALTRTDDAVGMVAAAGVDDGVVVNDFDAADIYSEITEVTDALGNVFVRIPKFYIEKTAVGAARTWRISKSGPGTTGYLPACFWDFTNEVELPYIYVGKYNASLGAGNKLESKAGVPPLVDRNIVNFRTYAQANGAGYQQLDIHVVDMLQVLFYVEFATLDSQSIMQGLTTARYTATDLATVAENGVNRIIVANASAAQFVVGQTISVGTSPGGNQIFYGRTITAISDYDASNKAIEFDGAAVNIAVGNMVYSTGAVSGFSSGIAASSGSPVSNSTGKYPCMYRGVENPWGSVWQCVDGVNINERQAWVCPDAAQYASNLFAAPYEQLSYVNHNANGYTTSMGLDPDRQFAALPIAIAANINDAAYRDNYYPGAGQRIALLGAGWNYGSLAGLSSWHLTYASSDASVNVSGRLLAKTLL